MSIKQSTGKAKSGVNDAKSSISNILKIIKAAFSMNKDSVSSLPPALILTGGKLRGGLSARNVASRIMSRRSEAGLPSGDIFPNSPNTDELMERIRIEELTSAILTEIVVQVAIQPGLRITGSGVGNLGSPVIIQGATTEIGTGTGIIS